MRQHDRSAPLLVGRRPEDAAHQRAVARQEPDRLQVRLARRCVLGQRPEAHSERARPCCCIGHRHRSSRDLSRPTYYGPSARASGSSTLEIDWRTADSPRRHDSSLRPRVKSRPWSDSRRAAPRRRRAAIRWRVITTPPAQRAICVRRVAGASRAISSRRAVRPSPTRSRAPTAGPPERIPQGIPYGRRQVSRERAHFCG